MNASSIIESITLNTTEKKALAAAQARLAALAATADAFRDPAEAVAEGRASALFDAVCETATAAVENPTTENLWAHLRALADAELAVRHRPALVDLGRRAVAAAEAPLRTVALAILDRAEGELDRLAVAGAEHAQAAGLAAEHAAKVAEVRAELVRERAIAADWPGPRAWLAGYGFV